MLSVKKKKNLTDFLLLSDFFQVIRELDFKIKVNLM